MVRSAAARLMLYFAYGSNLDGAQMQRRCAGARCAGRAILRDYRLLFDGHSRTWQGPVASVWPQLGAQVPGLLYELDATHIAELDRIEGHPTSYLRTDVSVLLDAGTSTLAQTYLRPPAASAFARGVPPAAYLRVMQTAYEHWGFDIGSLLEAAR